MSTVARASRTRASASSVTQLSVNHTRSADHLRAKLRRASLLQTKNCTIRARLQSAMIAFYKYNRTPALPQVMQYPRTPSVLQPVQGLLSLCAVVPLLVMVSCTDRAKT